MRVAIVGPYPLGQHVDGGIEGVMLELTAALRRLPDADLDVQVVTVGRVPVAVAHQAVTPIPPAPSGRWRLFLPERRQIGRVLERLAPDIIHVQGLNFYSAAIDHFNGPVVMTPHGMLAYEARIVDDRSGAQERFSKRVRGLGNTLFEQRALRRANDLIAINPYAEQVLGPRTTATWHHVHNPISQRFFDLAPRTSNSRLLFVGAIEPRKAVHDLVASVILVMDRRPQVTMRLVGPDRDARYAHEVRSLIAASGFAQRFVFAGALTPEEVVAAYEDSDIVVLSSLEETSPLVLQQAMAGRRAVVATAAGGVPWIVEDGVTGRLTPPGEPHALADALLDAVDNCQHTNRLIAGARVVADERFHPARVAAATLAIYRALVEP